MYYVICGLPNDVNAFFSGAIMKSMYTDKRTLVSSAVSTPNVIHTLT